MERSAAQPRVGKARKDEFKLLPEYMIHFGNGLYRRSHHRSAHIPPGEECTTTPLIFCEGGTQRQNPVT